MAEIRTKPITIITVGSVIVVSVAVLVVFFITIQQNKVQKDEALDIEKPSAKNFFQLWNPALFEEKLVNAKEVCMIATANENLIASINETLKEVIRRGGKIKCIYAKPESNAVAMSANQGYGPDRKIDTINIQIKSSLKTMQDIASVSTNNDSVQVKCIDHLFSSVISMIDHDKPDGTIFVTLNGFCHHFSKRPHFILSKKKDGEIYSFFQEIFENMWKADNCELLDLTKEIQGLVLISAKGHG